jgi:hypothetical protein
VRRALRGIVVLVMVVSATLWATPGCASAASSRRPAVPRTPWRAGAAAIEIDPTVTTYAAGFAASPPIPPGHVAGPHLSVRALYISNGHAAVELESLDSQAEFAAYQEGPSYGISAAREQAARAIDAAGYGPPLGPQDIIVQATHGHATPTLEGLWGPVPIAYLREVTQAEERALVQAAARARPARLRFGTADASALDDVALAQYDAFAGWADDPLLSVLRASDADTGQTIATYVTVPAHPDIVCGQCLALESADYPGAVRAALERQLGGVAIVGSGTLGREETPVQATGPADERLFATQVTNLVDAALASAHALAGDQLGGVQQLVQIPGTGAALLALVEANHLPAAQKQALEQSTGEYPIDRADTPPYLTGTLAGTWVTALRVGNVAYLSMPGEPFPEVREELAAATRGATVVALSKGQDDLGYFYPSYVTPFTEVYPSDTFINSASAETGDVVAAGQDENLRALGFDTSAVLPRPAAVDAPQTVSPGLQVVGGPFDTDAGPSGAARVRLLATYSPPDLPEGTLAYGLPAGSAPVDEQARGAVHWELDPGTASSGDHDFSGSDRAPVTIAPAFAVGVHRVRAWVASATGQVAGAQVLVIVHPRLRVRILARRRGRRVWLRTLTAGGDGTILAVRWRLAAGGTSSRRSITVAPGEGPVQVTVTDGTGTTAQARIALPR